VTLTASGPNAEQISFWNAVRGRQFVELQAYLDRQLGEMGLLAIERSGIRAGERVLDVGCGCGHTTLQLAERVGAAGCVTGVDVSAPMLERAGQRAGQAGLANVRFENADAQTFGFAPGSFELVYSRFGVMFFADPTAAFANLRGALVADGRLVFVCWQALQHNPWMRVPLAAAAQHVALPPPPAPDAPGPFSFADAERVRRILEAAGFRELGFESLERAVTLGGELELERAVEFALAMGPLGAALSETPEVDRRAVAESVRGALAPYAGAQGVRLPAAAWIVSARA